MTVATLTNMILEAITKQNYHIANFSKLWSALEIRSIMVILTAQKRQTTFWKSQKYDKFVWLLFQESYMLKLLLSCFVGHPVE